MALWDHKDGNRWGRAIDKGTIANAREVALSLFVVENRPTKSVGAIYKQFIKTSMEGEVMPEVTVVFWRDIPAQVIVGKGRRGAKRQLEERFEQAIDRAAMKVNAKDSDAYLAEWRKAEPYSVDGDPAEVAEAEAKRLETEYDREKLIELIANDGWS